MRGGRCRDAISGVQQLERMHTTEATDVRAYDRIAKAIRYLEDHQEQQPRLADLSAHVGISEYHLQRLFSDWVGVSPKQFLQYLTKESAKRRLRSTTVMDAALSAGLSGPGRLHDLMIKCEGMTPGEYKRHGHGLIIHYGIHESPFGACLLATTARGICKLAFFDTDAERERLVRELAEEWSEARIARADSVTLPLMRAAFGTGVRERKPLHLLLKGSRFQLKVWEALVSVPAADLVAYEQVAALVGLPSAARAVASAIAKNEIAYLIPCHRVIRKSGSFGRYRWGSERKKAIIGWEASRQGRSRAGGQTR